MNQGKDVEEAGDDCVVGNVVGGGDESEEEKGEGDEDGDGVDEGGVGGGSAGEVHLIGPGFFSRCCFPHVQAVLRAVLEMRVKL